MKQKCFITVFIFMLLIILPNVCFFIDTPQDNIENRRMADKPELKIGELQSFPQKYTEYYEDHMPLKEGMLKVNAFLKYILFNISIDNAVIVGDDGWLFYNSKEKEGTDTVADYLGTNEFSDKDLVRYKEMLLNMKASCEAVGAHFVFVIAPNKMTIYGDDHMPAAYRKTYDESRTDRLVRYLRESTDIEIVYPKKQLLSKKDEGQLYYKLDSHWNELGGYIGYRELYKMMFGRELDVAKNEDISMSLINTGDLATMSKLSCMRDSQYTMKYKDEIQVERKYEDNYFEFTSTSQTKDRLLMFRDSYAISMEKYLTKDFSQGKLIWTPIFDAAEILANKPTVVIYEVVERSAGEIIGVNHSFITINSINEIIDQEKFAEDGSSENIVSECMVDTDQVSYLKVQGFSFLENTDSCKTTAELVFVGKKSYCMGVDLQEREDVVNSINVNYNILKSGMDLCIDISDLPRGRYSIFIKLENNGIQGYHLLQDVLLITN